MESNHWMYKSINIPAEQEVRPISLFGSSERSQCASRIYLEALQVCIYGLTDESRSWYLKLREELLKSGAVVSKYNQSIFTRYFGNKLCGIIATHIDDFCFAGSEIFQTRVIDMLRRLFKIKSKDVAVPIQWIEHKEKQG